jgi:hypothetical protein
MFKETSRKVLISLLRYESELNKSNIIYTYNRGSFLFNGIYKRYWDKIIRTIGWYSMFIKLFSY